MILLKPGFKIGTFVMLLWGAALLIAAWRHYTHGVELLPALAKYVLCADMLPGRLEYLTLVIIFARDFWKW
jgi:hypothetical protein